MLDLSLMLYARSLTPDARIWLTRNTHAHVLHVFESTCNLIDDQNDILSLVTPQVGNGPFSIVVQANFATHVDIDSEVHVGNDSITIGSLSIDTSNAEIWQPRPRWEQLHSQIDFLLSQLPTLTNLLRSDAPRGSFAPFAYDDVSTTSDSMQDKVLEHARQPAFLLTQGIASNDRDACRNAAMQLAGLGGGLTPSGDDFIVGALYAMWATRSDVATIAQSIIDAAIPRTTHLSAAWLRAAARGEAGSLWHRFIDALIAHDHPSMLEAIGRIVRIGHTSGADALSGFVATIERLASISK